MDNFRLDIVSEKQETFKLAMEIALKHHRSVSHYAVIDYKVDVNEWLKKNAQRKTLILFWHDDESFKPRCVPFPYPMKGEALITFVWHWLEDAWENNAHGDEPDHDGSNHNGWRIFNEVWGHVAESHYGVMAVQPVWAMFGK